MGIRIFPPTKIVEIRVQNGNAQIKAKDNQCNRPRGFITRCQDNEKSGVEHSKKDRISQK
jgi:hypothetical protein